MTMSSVASEPTGDRQGSPAPRYRYSVLVTGAARMWRATRVVVPTIVVNALVQGLLVLPTQSAFAGWVLVVTALGSAAVWLVTLGLVVSAALECYGPTRPTWPDVRLRLAGAWVPYAGWTAALFVAAVIGFALWTWPGALVLAAGLFVPLCALAGQRPLPATWAIIRRRPVRWAVTVTVVLTLGLLASLLTAVLWFFVPLFVGVAIANLVWGLLGWWWATGLASLYLTVNGREPPVD